MYIYWATYSDHIRSCIVWYMGLQIFKICMLKQTRHEYPPRSAALPMRHTLKHARMASIPLNGWLAPVCSVNSALEAVPCQAHTMFSSTDQLTCTATLTNRSPGLAVRISCTGERCMVVTVFRKNLILPVEFPMKQLHTLQTRVI